MTPAEIRADETPFALETPVIARGRDYSFDGRIVAVFRKYGGTQRLDGPLRYVVEDSRGLLLIHSPRTLEKSRDRRAWRANRVSAAGDDEIVEAMAKEIYRCSPLTVDGVAVDWDSETAISHPTLREQSEVEARAALAAARPLIERAARASADADNAALRARLAKAEEALQILAGGRAVSDDPGADLAAAWREHVEVMQGLARHALAEIRAIPIPDTTAADDDVALADAEVEKIMEMTDAEVDAALRAEGKDPEKVAEDMRKTIDRVLVWHDALEKAREALRRICQFLDPLADSVFNDNGDVTVTNPPLFGYEGYCDAYFLRRSADEALAAIDAAKAKGGG